MVILLKCSHLKSESLHGRGTKQILPQQQKKKKYYVTFRPSFSYQVLQEEITGKKQTKKGQIKIKYLLFPKRAIHMKSS